MLALKKAAFLTMLNLIFASAAEAIPSIIDATAIQQRIHKVWGSLDDSAQISSELEQIQAVSELNKIGPLGDVANAYVHVISGLLNHIHRNRTISDHRRDLLKGMLKGLSETGDATYWRKLKDIWEVHRELEIPELHEEIAPEMRRALDAMSSRFSQPPYLSSRVREQARSEAETLKADADEAGKGVVIPFPSRKPDRTCDLALQ